jgi:RNA-binding protein
MPLTNSQKKYLRGLSHDLHPVVTVADKGLSENVLAEAEQALEHHELIKIKLRGEREQRDAWIDQLVSTTGAQLVHRIGQVVCLYRRHPEKPKIELPRK